MSNYKHLFGKFKPVYKEKDFLLVGCKPPLTPDKLSLLDIRYIAAALSGDELKVERYETEESSPGSFFSGYVKIWLTFRKT